MKAIMYHYVRNYNKEYPHYKFLKKEDFLKQLNSFSKEGIVSDEKEIYKCEKENILTFDDGLKDHIWVAEELSKKKMIGLFFISTLPYERKKILDVHRAHLILGKVGGKIALWG